MLVELLHLIIFRFLAASNMKGQTPLKCDDICSIVNNVTFKERCIKMKIESDVLRLTRVR